MWNLAGFGVSPLRLRIPRHLNLRNSPRLSILVQGESSPGTRVSERLELIVTWVVGGGQMCEVIDSSIPRINIQHAGGELRVDRFYHFGHFTIAVPITIFTDPP